MPYATFFINQTDMIGSLLNYTTMNVTGSVYLTMAFVFAIFIGFTMLFRLPFELGVFVCFPMLLVFVAYGVPLVGALIALVVLFGVIIAKRFLLG